MKASGKSRAGGDKRLQIELKAEVAPTHVLQCLTSVVQAAHVPRQVKGLPEVSTAM